jgi:hypothetical protein
MRPSDEIRAHGEAVKTNRSAEHRRRSAPARRGAALLVSFALAFAATACGDSGSGDATTGTGGDGASGSTSAATSGTGGPEPITATTSEGTWNGQPFAGTSAAVDGPLQAGYRRLTVQQECACTLAENHLRVAAPFLSVDLPTDSNGAFDLGVHQAKDVNVFIELPCSDGDPLGPSESATGGTVDVVSDDGNVVTGRYAVSFPSGAQLSGTFYAPTCPDGASTIKCVDADWMCDGSP